MNFFDKMKSHVGGLLLLETDLYWYYPGTWDGIVGRICLLLDVPPSDIVRPLDATTRKAFSTAPARVAYALLLIDNQPRFVLISKEAVKFIK